MDVNYLPPITCMIDTNRYGFQGYSKQYKSLDERLVCYCLNKTDFGMLWNKTDFGNLEGVYRYMT